MNVPVIIPAYDPTERLLEVIDGLKEQGFEKIIVIDDGSRPECAAVFADVEAAEGCVVLRHSENRGKGRALKTGFRYIVNNIPGCDGAVTADDDGQHVPADIYRCAEKMARTGTAVLGARDFGGRDVPPKSRFGNSLTRLVFRVLCGIKISDTQTGLRALPFSCLETMCGISGEDFEYETNMLLEMKRLSISFTEEKISTIYLGGNRGTHFHPLTDSLKIYSVILKFALSSAICSLIDIGLFTLLNMLLIPLFGDDEWLRVFVAAFCARVISSMLNFLLNRRRVFRSGSSVKRSAVRYYILCAVQFTLSYFMVSGLTYLFGTEKSLWQTLIKAVSDTLLFFISFGVQRDWVYAD